ncbi:COP1-interactive protein 1 [Gossypium hirsutum]|uniref:COP1-interactive protein 1 n=1 Tax=Gossypium hirsutum TaxID=3635 RepID=A0ABM3AMU4_GOSHI|nr:COP1-interactive protein 1-like [Gossypium hirsutum]
MTIITKTFSPQFTNWPRGERGKKEPVLVGLVEDFHKQYQFLYSQYENVKRQSDKKVSDWNEPKIILIMPLVQTRRITRRWMSKLTPAALKKIGDLNHQLASKTEENELLALDHLAALSKIQEIEIINKDLRKEADEKEKRLCDSETVHEGRITELEEQLIGLKNEVESLQFQKRDLEAQLDAKTAETKLQGKTIKALYGKVSEVRDEATKFMKQVEDNDNNLTSKLEESMVQITGLKAEMDYLRAQSSEIDVMAEEKEGLQMQVMELESEVDVLRKQKHKLDNNERSNICKINQLREETSHLNGRIGSTISAKKVEFMMMEKSELELRIADQKRIMKGRQENTNKSMESNSKLARRLLTGTTFNINVLEVKDKEMLEQENGALREKTARNALSESNSRLEQDNRKLGEKLATCDAEVRKSRDTMEAWKNAWAESISRLEHENGHLKEKLATCEVELRKSRDSMELMQENRELGEKLSCEGKLSKEEEEEKVKPLKAIADLESRIGEMEKITKEKDKALLGREEEKRKAIRVLCLLIDYHRRRYDRLKEMVSGRTKKKKHDSFLHVFQK